MLDVSRGDKELEEDEIVRSTPFNSKGVLHHECANEG